MISKQRAVVFTTILILSALSLGISFTKSAVSPLDAEEKSLKTSDDLQSLRLATFRYVETMGSVPPKLADLWVKGAQPDIAFDSTRGIGTGWVGPYVTDDIVEHLGQRDQDRFGNPLKYVMSADGIRIQSAGRDGKFGNIDDLTTQITQEELFSDVTGRIVRGDRPAASVRVTMNMPRSGVPFEISTQTDLSGAYAFSDVPVGMRSVTLEKDSSNARRVITVNVQPQTAAVVPDIVLNGQAK